MTGGEARECCPCGDPECGADDCIHAVEAEAALLEEGRSAPSAYAPRPLRLGQRVSLDEPGGAAWEVVRVSECSATLKRRGERVRVTVERPLRRGEEPPADGSRPLRTFEAWEGGGTVTVSARAFVWEAGE